MRGWENSVADDGASDRPCPGGILPRLRQVMVLCSILLGTMAHDGFADARLERGAYLVEGIANCDNCHAPQGPSGAVPLTGWSSDPDPGLHRLSTKHHAGEGDRDRHLDRGG